MSSLTQEYFPCCWCSASIEAATHSLAVYDEGGFTENMYGCNDDAIESYAGQKYPGSELEWYQSTNRRQCWGGKATPGTGQAVDKPGYSLPISGNTYGGESSQTPQTQPRRSTWEKWKSMSRQAGGSSSRAKDKVIGTCLTCKREVKESQRTLQLFRVVEGKRSRKGKSTQKKQIAYFDTEACLQFALDNPNEGWLSEDGSYTPSVPHHLVHLGAFRDHETPHDGDTYPMNVAHMFPRDEDEELQAGSLPGHFSLSGTNQY